MPKPRALSPQSVWDAEAVCSAFAAAGVPNVEHHVTRLWGHLIRHPSSSWHDLPDFPESALAALDASFVKFTTKLHAVQRSTDGETLKLLLQLQGGMQVEAVVMRHDTQCKHNRDSSAASTSGGLRSTLCVSSQVGCQMGCKFCATGTMGLLSNLTAGEIVEQLAHALQLTTVRNVVFMGMGEPLDNYAAVSVHPIAHVQGALKMMLDERLFALASRHVTVSSVGVIPKIGALARDFPRVSFALSLHAPTQELRERIVPSAKAHKLDKLMAAIKGYQDVTGQKVFIEYVLLEGVNDSVAVAVQLGDLLKGHNVTVNLIPWNPVLSPDMHFGAPVLEQVLKFQTVLRRQFGIACTVRQEKGQEISGACGQLVVQCQSGPGAVKGLADIEEVAARLLSKVALVR